MSVNGFDAPDTFSPQLQIALPHEMQVHAPDIGTSLRIADSVKLKSLGCDFLTLFWQL